MFKHGYLHYILNKSCIWRPSVPSLSLSHMWWFCRTLDFYDWQKQIFWASSHITLGQWHTYKTRVTFPKLHRCFMGTIVIKFFMWPYLEVLIRKIGKTHQNNTFRIYNKFEPCQIRCIKLKISFMKFILWYLNSCANF